MDFKIGHEFDKNCDLENIVINCTARQKVKNFLCKQTAIGC